MGERQLTTAPHGHMLTNAAVFSADSRWIVYDTRSGADGSVFDIHADPAAKLTGKEKPEQVFPGKFKIQRIGSSES